MLKTCSLFAGMGGMCKAASNVGGTIVFANEVDGHACRTYRHNFKHEILKCDIRDVKAESIPDHELLMAGFPCQSFSVAGYRKGFGDARGQLFFEITRIIDAKMPRFVLLENVRNLKTHDKKRTYRRIRQELIDRGYQVKDAILNSKDFGIPQNRPRIFIVCSTDNIDNFAFPSSRPTIDTDNQPPPIRSFVDFEGMQDDKYYLPATSKYYGLFENMKEHRIYQLRRYYIRENKSGICPTLTANMGGGGHNVPFIKDARGIRKLTEYECLALQGFEKDFSFPEDMALSHRYKQIGNSVTVPVVETILYNLLKYMGDKNHVQSTYPQGGHRESGEICECCTEQDAGRKICPRQAWDPRFWGEEA